MVINQQTGERRPIEFILTFVLFIGVQMRVSYQEHLLESQNQETQSSVTPRKICSVYDRSIASRFLFCLFVAFCQSSRIFHPYGDVTITGEGLQILTYPRYSWL